MNETFEKYLNEKAFQTHTPLNACLELLPLCNMNCDMCFVRLSPEEMAEQGHLRTGKEWIALAEQMQKAGTLFVSLTGGEPLLYPDFKEVYLGLRSLGMIITINTNGTLIDEKWADFFAKNKPRRINITLYGADDEAYRKLCHYPNGFEKTLRGIWLLRTHGIDVKINGSIVKANHNDLRALVDFAKKLDTAVVIETYMMPATRERTQPYNFQSRLKPEDAAARKLEYIGETLYPEERKEQYKEMIKTVNDTPSREQIPGKMECQAGRVLFFINWQGYMRPCVMLTEPSIPVFEMEFNKAWKQLQEGVAKYRLSAMCHACTLRNICQTCAACAYWETGDYQGTPEYMCRYTKETLRLLKEEYDG